MKRLKIYWAHCNKCGEDFEFIPRILFSIKEPSDTAGIPRCPTCKSYMETVDKGRVDRSYEKGERP